MSKPIKPMDKSVHEQLQEVTKRAVVKDWTKPPVVHPDAAAVVTESSPTHFKLETISDLEQKLAAMVDERLASLARRVEYLESYCGEDGLAKMVISLQRRVDLLYRYTVGDRAGGRYMVPNMHQRGEEFPEAEP